MKNVLDDYEEVVSLLKNKQYDLIYKEYRQVIEALLFVTSEDEFADFIREIGYIEMDSFLLELAAQRDICFALSVNDVMSTLSSYIENESNLILDAKNKTIVDILSKANECDNKMRYIAFFDDQYSDGIYYLFHVEKNVDFTICEGAKVSRII